VEVRLAEGEQFAPIRAFGSKAAEHALRMAGVLTLVDRMDAKHIDADHMKAGITLAQFYLKEWLRLFHVGTENPDIVLAEKLLSWAQQYDAVYLSKVYQFGPYGVRDKQTALRLIAILEGHGWLVRIPGGKNIDGAHRIDAWEVIRGDVER
jgi:hypothetical protein